MYFGKFTNTLNVFLYFIYNKIYSFILIKLAPGTYIILMDVYYTDAPFRIVILKAMIYHFSFQVYLSNKRSDSTSTDHPMSEVYIFFSIILKWYTKRQKQVVIVNTWYTMGHSNIVINKTKLFAYVYK